MADIVKCTTFAEFIRLLNNGGLHADLSAALPEIAAALENHGAENGGKAKGRLVLTVDFELKKGVYELYADFTTKLPKVARDRTIAWATPDNFFSPQDPRQVEMFNGPRAVVDVNQGEGAARNA